MANPSPAWAWSPAQLTVPPWLQSAESQRRPDERRKNCRTLNTNKYLASQHSNHLLKKNKSLMSCLQNLTSRINTQIICHCCADPMHN
jgi:hypothetical protein